jgi:hypothetical protein
LVELLENENLNIGIFPINNLRLKSNFSGKLLNKNGLPKNYRWNEFMEMPNFL